MDTRPGHLRSPRLKAARTVEVGSRGPGQNCGREGVCWWKEGLRSLCHEPQAGSGAARQTYVSAKRMGEAERAEKLIDAVAERRQRRTSQSHQVPGPHEKADGRNSRGVLIPAPSQHPRQKYPLSEATPARLANSPSFQPKLQLSRRKHAPQYSTNLGTIQDPSPNAPAHRPRALRTQHLRQRPSRRDPRGLLLPALRAV